MAAAMTLVREAPDEELRLLLHQVHAHQIELQLQNEELQRAHEELEASRLKYVDLYDAAPVGYATLDRGGVILDANLTLAARLGVAREELRGRPLSRFVSAASVDEFALQVQRLFESGQGASAELRMMNEGGAPFWGRMDAILREAEPAATATCRIVLTDVSERRQEEERRRESDLIFSSTFHDSPVAMAMTSTTDGTFFDVNEVFLSQTGWSRDEVIGRTSLQLGLFPDPGERDRLVADILEKGVVYGCPAVLQTRDRARLEVLFSARAVRSGGSEYLFFSLVVVTEKTRAERALMEAEERFRTFFEQSPVGMAIVTLDGKLRRVNDALSDLLGYSSGELRSLTLEAIMHPEDRPLGGEAARALHARYGDTALQEKRFLKRDGTETWVHVTSRLLRDTGGAPLLFLTHVLDISSRKAAELALGESFELLERRVKERTADLAAANREMEAFTYSVSHDLRSPLRAIDGFGARLDSSCGPEMGDEGRRFLGVIRANARRMAVLIDELLAFSKIGRTELKPEWVDMEAMALEVGRELLGSEVRHDADFIVGPLPDAWGCRGLLRQVWQNLLSNAFKFSSKVARPSIQVEGADEGGVVWYRVRDNGAGFDMAYRDKLFGVFQRLHTTAEFPGVGIGLALVERVVGRHGGVVAAEGAVGQGATFTFSLPSPPEDGALPPGPDS